MQLDISVFIDERHEFKHAEDAGLVGYLRPSMAMTDFPDRPATSATLQTIVWDMDCPGGARAVPIELMPNVSNAICTFYNRYRGKKAGMDCYGFINLVARKPLHNISQHEVHWTRQEITKRQIDPGDILTLNTFFGKFQHAAVCIAPDLFISIYGMDGEIEFGTLADIYESYRAERIYLVTPR